MLKSNRLNSDSLVVRYLSTNTLPKAARALSALCGCIYCVLIWCGSSCSLCQYLACCFVAAGWRCDEVRVCCTWTAWVQATDEKPVAKSAADSHFPAPAVPFCRWSLTLPLGFVLINVCLADITGFLFEIFFEILHTNKWSFFMNAFCFLCFWSWWFDPISLFRFKSV